MRDFVCNGRPFAFIARYLWRYRAAHALVLLAVIGAATASVGARYSIKFLVDAMAQGPWAVESTWSAFVIFAACVGADNLLWRVAGFAAARSFPAVGADLRLDLFRHLLGHSARYFNARFSGALASRISTAATALFTVGNTFIWNVLPAGAATLGALIGLGAVRWQIAGALSLAAGAIALGIVWAALRGRPIHHAYADRAAAVGGEIIDVVTNHGTVRVFAGAEREEARLAGVIAEEASAQRRALTYVERLRFVHAIAVWGLSGAVVAWSIQLWSQGVVTPGDVVVCGAFTLALLQASRDLAVALVEITYDWSRVSEAVRTLMVPHDLTDAPSAAPLVPRGGTIEFEHVGFEHDGEHAVLHDVTFRIGAGEQVGIVGPSGAGKSTLLSVLQRLYPVSRGRILIDGQDIATLRQESLHRAIAVVPQEISLFNRSILENIRYGRPDASDEDVMAAARAACCEEFIRELPDGYATLAGERGVRLSAGQKQRLAIARAILADAPVILLDEATSALDAHSEIAVQQALAALSRGRTILAVAHRLSTIAGLDRVIVLDRGRIVEDGPPELLRRRNGAFARLWRAQMDEREKNAPPAGDLLGVTPMPHRVWHRRRAVNFPLSRKEV